MPKPARPMSSTERRATAKRSLKPAERKSPSIKRQRMFSRKWVFPSCQRSRNCRRSMPLFWSKKEPVRAVQALQRRNEGVSEGTPQRHQNARHQRGGRDQQNHKCRCESSFFNLHDFTLLLRSVGIKRKLGYRLPSAFCAFAVLTADSCGIPFGDY